MTSQLVNKKLHVDKRMIIFIVTSFIGSLNWRYFKSVLKFKKRVKNFNNDDWLILLVECSLRFCKFWSPCSVT